MLQNLINTEIYSAETNNYLLIHKNGCTQITALLKNKYKEVKNLDFLPNSNPYWTTIRDPYNRFISGLTYDILQVYGNLDNLTQIFNFSNLKNLFFNRYKSTTLEGFTSHTIPQWVYLFNQPINFFVDVNDLNLFLNIHFEDKIIDKNEGSLTHKNVVDNYIKSSPKIKQYIDNLLSPDYFLYNNIISKNLLWSWQAGKMF